MSLTCPNCSSTGRREAIGLKRDVPVAWCPACNVVFDGLAPSGFTADSSSVEEMPAAEWADRIEEARAALERAQIAKKLAAKAGTTGGAHG